MIDMKDPKERLKEIDQYAIVAFKGGDNKFMELLNREKKGILETLEWIEEEIDKIRNKSCNTHNCCAFDLKQNIRKILKVSIRYL